MPATSTARLRKQAALKELDPTEVACVCLKAQLALPMQPQEEQEHNGGTPQSCSEKGLLVMGV